MGIRMTDTETQKELEELKRQVAALSEARRAQREPTKPQASEASAEAAATVEHGFSAHVEELVDLMGHELRDNPVATGVAIFVAGLLVGRLLR
jgi:hypothetical protein